MHLWNLSWPHLIKGNEYYVKVIARDGGGILNEPHRDATTEVVITIEDINDNPPRFVECPEVISFDEDEQIGMDGPNPKSVRVSDRDIYENGDVEFTIDDKTGTFGIYSKQLEGDRKGSTFLSKSFRLSFNLNLGQIIRYNIQFRD